MSASVLPVFETRGASIASRVEQTGVITTIAGYGYGAGSFGMTGGFGGDYGPATAAELWFPVSLFLDAEKDLYIADFLNSRIRKVTF